MTSSDDLTLRDESSKNNNTSKLRVSIYEEVKVPQRWISEEDVIVSQESIVTPVKTPLNPFEDSSQSPSEHDSTSETPLPPSWTSDFLSDFERHFGPVSPECRRHHLRVQSSFSWRFTTDFVLCHAVFGPALISFWRGTWDYYGLEMGERYGDDCLTPNLICLVAGFVVSLLLQLFQYEIRRWLAGKHKESLRFKTVARVYSLVLGWFDIYFWKGVWDGYNCLWGAGESSVEAALVTLTGGVMALTLSGTLSSLMCSPIGVVLDSEDKAMRTSTYLSTKSTSSFFLRLLDVLVSLFLEGLVTLSWHGLWTLEDIATYKYGLSNAETAWTSLALGLLSGYLVFLLQFPLASITRSCYFQRKDQNGSCGSCGSCFLLLLLRFLFNLLGGFATINGFRAIWYLMDEYYMADNYEYSLLSGQALGVLILFVLGAGASLHPGITCDLPREEDELLLPFHYLTYHYIKESDVNHGPRQIGFIVSADNGAKFCGQEEVKVVLM